jgi:hypothetical protein
MTCVKGASLLGMHGAHTGKSGQNLAQSGVGANGERTADERRGGVRAGERRTGVDVPGSALDDGWKLPSPLPMKMYVPRGGAV